MNGRRSLLMAFVMLGASVIILVGRFACGVDEPAVERHDGTMTPATIENAPPALPDGIANSARRPESPRSASRMLLGRIVDAAGSPIIGTRVELHGGRSPIGVTSGSDGRFLFEGIGPQEDLSLFLSAEGFAPRDVTVGVLDADESRDLGDLVLERGRRITGRVVAMDGAPIGGAWVGLVAHLPFQSRADIDYFRIFDRLFADDRIMTSTRTDDDGRFAIERAAMGSWVLAVHADGYQARYSQSFDVVRSEDSPPIVVALSTSASLEGILVDGDGLPCADVSIAALERGAPFAYVVKTFKTKSDETGAFRFDSLGTGEYLIYARDRDGRMATAEGVRAGTRVSLTLPRSTIVRGVVRDVADGNGLGGVEIAVISGSSLGFARTTTTDDGSFTLGIAPGAGATLLARHPEYVIVKPPDAKPSRFTGGIALDVVAGTGEVSIDVPMTRGAGVGGVVRDRATGLPIEGARIRYLVPRRYVGTSFRRGWTSRSAKDGRFDLEHLPPGEIEFVVLARGYAMHRHRILESIPDGEIRDSIIVDLSASTSVAGRLVDDRDHPIRGGRVRAILDEENETPDALATDDLSVLSDGEGRFLLDHLPLAGVVALEALHPSGGTAVRAPIGSRSGRDDIRIVVPRPSSVRGRLLAADGGPMTGARLAWITEGGERDDRAWRTNHDRRTIVTDRDGWFSAARIASGNGRFVVAPDSEFALDAPSSEEIFLAPGSERAVTLYLAPPEPAEDQ